MCNTLATLRPPDPVVRLTRIAWRIKQLPLSGGSGPGLDREISRAAAGVVGSTVGVRPDSVTISA